MLEPNSVGQILRVLELLRQNKRLGFETSNACSRAIQQVAKESDVRYQTIGDGCRRRLGLVDMSEFHRLAEDWLRGNSAPLITVLKTNSDRSAASRIEAFFTRSGRTGNGDQKAAAVPRSAPSQSSGPSPVIITLEDADARMLRVLAQLEDREPDAVGVELLRAGMRDRLRAALV